MIRPLLALAVLAAPASPQAFNLDVGQNLILSPTPSITYGAAAGQPGFWNDVPPDFAPLVLNDLAGAPTGATVRTDFTASRNVFPSVMPPGDDQKLMEDLADMPNLGQVVTWTFAGLADGGYDVFTYAADPASGNAMTEVTVVGSPDPTQLVVGPWPGSHVLGSTYARHQVVVSGGALEVRFLAIGPPLFENGALNGFQLVPSSSNLGTSYCGPAIPNSSGSAATIFATGSGVAGQPVTLTAQGMPTSVFGIFLTGRTQGFFNPPGSQGNICLSGNIGRFNAPSQIRNTGATGSFQLVVDTTSLPVNPTMPALPGETWNFQAWFRDGGGTTSNFTDGVSIPFQ